MAFDATAVQAQFPVGRIVVLGREAAHRHELAETIRSLGHQVGDTVHEPAGLAAEAWIEVDTVLILAEEDDAGWAGHAMTIRRQPAAPPLVVLGPRSGSTWRSRALKAGAFLCACREAPAEELQSILLAAIRHRSLEKEINLLRIECERICLGLLKSYGEAAATLKDTAGEVEALERNLSDIRNQIIRAFV
jgi:AmiR/NasT family two-component response regulator